MPLRRLLTTLGLRDDGAAPPDDPFLARLHAQLQRIGAARLEFLAGFAGQLARVAVAEGGISPDEASAMRDRLTAQGGIADDDAAVIVDLLRHEFEILRDVQNHQLSRAINEHGTPADKQAVVDCLYAVAAADHLVSDVEEQEIRRIADALLVPHSVLMDIRGRYRDRLEALQNLPRR